MIFHYLKFFLISILFFYTTLLSANYSIVLIHIGNAVPSYTEVAIKQARLFNPDCPIYLIADAFPAFSSDLNITFVPSSSLVKSTEHQKFLKNHNLNDAFRNGFWLYTSERFLYLQDLIEQFNLKNVFHIENDVMVYRDLNEILPVFIANYPGIGATFDNDGRCIPGFVYVRSRHSMRALADCFANYSKKGKDDMHVIGIFKRLQPALLEYLPVLPEDYINTFSLTNLNQHYTSTHPKTYCTLFKDFNSIFDAAALGQYIGGGDGRNGECGPGFINESALYNPSYFTYEFIEDSMGRKVPFAVLHGKKTQINNLHIHSKNLQAFYSL